MILPRQIQDAARDSSRPWRPNATNTSPLDECRSTLLCHLHVCKYMCGATPPAPVRIWYRLHCIGAGCIRLSETSCPSAPCDGHMKVATTKALVDVMPTFQETMSYLQLGQHQSVSLEDRAGPKLKSAGTGLGWGGVACRDWRGPRLAEAVQPAINNS